MVEKFEVGHWYKLAEGVTEANMRYGWVDQMSPLLDRKPRRCLWVDEHNGTDVEFDDIKGGSWSYNFGDFDEVPAPQENTSIKSDIPMGDLPPTKERISMLCDAMKDLLLYKNEHYGDSALHPASIFYKGDAATSIYIRMDDKLNRIKNADVPGVNDIADFIGYGFLALAKRMETEDVLAAIEKEKD